MLGIKCMIYLGRAKIDNCYEKDIIGGTKGSFYKWEIK